MLFSRISTDEFGFVLQSWRQSQSDCLMKILVGQGLAGSLLAFQLLQKRCEFLVIDNPSIINGKIVSSSTTAGGELQL